jgi:molybdenum-dependent DNA-binding transcriptional regulator ModE
MEMQQMMECLLAKNGRHPSRNKNQAQMGASLRDMREEMLAKMETNQERTDAKIDAHHKRMMARMDSQLEKTEDTFGGKSRRNKSPRWSMRSLRKRPQWKLLEHQRSGMGTGI